MRKAVGALLVSAFSSLLASAAVAEEASCVSACADKTRDCAARCEALAGGERETCELACGRALLVSCVTDCQATNVVVWDDYQVRTVEEEPGGED